MKRSNFKIICRLIAMVKQLLPLILVAVAMGVAGFLSSILIAVFGGFGMLSVLRLSSPFTLKAVCVCVLVFAAVRGVLRYAEQATNHYIAFKLLAVIRDKVFTALRRLAPAKLDGREKGDLISIITTDIELLEVFYAHTISPVLIAAVVSILMTALAAQYHWILALIALCGYAVMGIALPLVIARIGKNTGKRYRVAFGEFNAFFLDRLRGLSEIMQYGAGKKALEDSETRTMELEEKRKKLKAAEGVTSALSNAVILLFSSVMFFAALALKERGIIQFDGVLIPTIIMLSSFGPVVALANLANNLVHTFAAGGRVLDILEESPVIEEVAQGEKPDFSGLQCDKVSFSYGGEQVLGDVTLTVPPYQTLGISGRSGSGKSTLLKLIMRFRDADTGAVKISGVNVKELNTVCLRETESYVTQETELFHDSIKNNIRIARLSASDEEIVSACKKASLHDFIMTLPRQYDTNVGELGDSLSAGEQQRIGVARAFLHNAPLLLLDEPTSNLDSLNEAVILKAVKEEAKDKTVILVSHRKSTMAIADRIYTVKNGRMS